MLLLSKSQQFNYFTIFLSKNIIILLNIIILMFYLTLATTTKDEKKNTKIKNNIYFNNNFDKITTMFWLNVEINFVEFKKGCLSTALCHRPTFKLVSIWVSY
jgi:hypothetical protein